MKKMPDPLIKQKQERYEQDINRVRNWFRARSGRVVTSRLLEPDDVDLLVEFFHHLSPESRRRRFHQNVEYVSDDLIQESARLLANVDNRTQGGAVLALEKDDDGTPRVIGVARLGRPPGKPNDPSAEAAIVIRDDYHGEGIGTELLRRLVLLAKQMKVKEMLAVIEADNTPAVRLFRELGLPTEIDTSQGETTMMIQIPE
jgi:RimJ/RimL family protein N-acetyltransferase